MGPWPISTFVPLERWADHELAEFFGDPLAQVEQRRLELLRELAADGYPVATASAIGALGLQLIDRPPDLVVLGDFAGPGAQARLLGELRNGQAPFTPAVADTPAIVLSEHHGELAVLRAFDAGGDDFIAKPAEGTVFRVSSYEVPRSPRGRSAGRGGSARSCSERHPDEQTAWRAVPSGSPPRQAPPFQLPPRRCSLARAMG